MYDAAATAARTLRGCLGVAALGAALLLLVRLLR